MFFAASGDFKADNLSVVNQRAEFQVLALAEEAYAAALKRDQQVLRISAMVIPIAAFFVVLPLVALLYYLPRYVARKQAFDRDFGQAKANRASLVEDLNQIAVVRHKIGFRAFFNGMKAQALPVWRGEPVQTVRSTLDESKVSDVEQAVVTPLAPQRRSRARTGSPISATQVSQITFMRKSASLVQSPSPAMQSIKVAA